MNKLYKIDDVEFEELIKNIALNNETIVDSSDPVLIFYTIAKFIFKEYANVLDEKINSIEYKQNEIIENFESYIDNLKTSTEQDVQLKIKTLVNNIKNSTDENVKLALYNVSEIVKSLEKSYNDTKENIAVDSLYNKLLILGNIVLSALTLYLIFFKF